MLPKYILLNLNKVIPPQVLLSWTPKISVGYIPEVDAGFVRSGTETVLDFLLQYFQDKN